MRERIYIMNQLKQSIKNYLFEHFQMGIWE